MEEVATACGAGLSAWPDERFDELARRVFRWQFEQSPAYGPFAAARGATPDTVRTWQDVPPVPARAFKRLRLATGDVRPGRGRVFRTSGTTLGERGEHHVPSLGLYRASLLPTFRTHVLADAGTLPFLSLIPSPAAQPDSSLSTMVGEAMDALGGSGSDWFAEGGAEGRPGDGPVLLDVRGLTRALREAEGAGEPVLLLGTAFSFVHWLDATEGPFRLPEGSRLMETGGFKGRSRTVARHELYAALEARLGVPTTRMVNEYGMTELLSQYYEPVLTEGAPGGPTLEAALAARRLAPPPWLRFQVLDPVTLDPLGDGEAGIVAHFDLANVGSVSAVLTEDLGVRHGGRLELLGRATGAAPRGCSVAMDELMSAARGA